MVFFCCWRFWAPLPSLPSGFGALRALLPPWLSLGTEAGSVLPIFLLSFAMGWFSIVVLSRLFTRDPQWWALIPGAIMSGIGTFVVLTEGPLRSLNEDAQGGLFMLMFAAGWVIVAGGATLFTRTLVWWPLIPGAIMGFIGAAVLLGGAWVQALKLVSDWWPLGLVGLGAWLLLRRRVTSNE